MNPTNPLRIFRKYLDLLVFRASPIAKSRIDGLDFYHPRRSPPHIPRLHRQGYELQDLLDQTSGDTTVDIGAHIGLYALRLARRFKRVIAFEPLPNNAYFLRVNVASNKLQNVQVEEVALSDEPGVTELYFRSVEGGTSSLNPRHYELEFDRSCQVKVARLDDYESQLSGLGLIKIDAEGHEVPILRGARSVIARFRPLIGVEVHTPSVRPAKSSNCRCEACKLLEEYGYDVAFVSELTGVLQAHWVWGTPSRN